MGSYIAYSFLCTIYLLRKWPRLLPNFKCIVLYFLLYGEKNNLFLLNYIDDCEKSIGYVCADNLWILLYSTDLLLSPSPNILIIVS